MGSPALDDAPDTSRPSPLDLPAPDAPAPEASAPEASALDLPPALDLRAAPDLAASLLAHRGGDVSLDGSSVRHLGGQCLQVLLSAQRTWAADGRTFRLLSASPELRAGAALLGEAELLCGEGAL